MQNKNHIDFSEIKLILLDLEGVLLGQGENKDKLVPLLKNFADSLKQLGCIAGIVTADKSDAVKDLNSIENMFVLHSAMDKLSAAQKLIDKLHLNFSSVFYMGDEVLDLPLLSKCGISAAPKTAKRNVKRSVKLIIDNSTVEKLLSTILNYKKGILV